MGSRGWETKLLQTMCSNLCQTRTSELYMLMTLYHTCQLEYLGSDMQGTRSGTALPFMTANLSSVLMNLES